MPLNEEIDLPKTEPKVNYLTLENFKRGVITLIDESRLPKDALKEADNLFLYEDGQPGVRPGVDWFGADVGATIDGFDYYDTGTVVHLVVAAGGSIYRSTNDGTSWTVCTGGSYTSGTTTNFNQNGGFLYITNGVDNILRYDGTTTLQTYTTLTTPGAPSKAETGLSGTGYSFYYKCAAVNQIGYSAASAASTVVQANIPRASWTSGTDYVTLTLDALQTSQTRYDIYISENDTDYFYLGSTSDTTFVDDGTAIPIPSTLAPTDNTTQGPLVEELTNVGSRQYGVRDQNNAARIWFSGAGQFSGAFSNAYDGGYLDWQEGGKYTPVKIVDYRDGRGTPYATIWCTSADGQGSILQMSLETLTVADISITVPSAYQLPGSRGTPAPGSVVNVLNDYYFYNSQAFYNLGSRQNLQQILSTDEMSANIRPSVKQITNSAEGNIASIYFDAKIYFSVPYGSTTNNAVCVYDTERKAWLPKAFDGIGFTKFLRYTATDGTQKLLGVKSGDSQITEISYAIQGDYGVAFNTSLITGLYPTVKNRFEFQWTEEGEVEFANPRGAINVQMLGIERTQGFSAIATQTVESITVNVGWDTFEWDSNDWDDTSTVPDTFSESALKRYFNVQKELNAVQWRITTSGKDSSYTLRTLQSWGTETHAGKPRTWKLTTN